MLKIVRNDFSVYPWMDGISQGAMDGGAIISMEGVADNFSMRDLHFLHPCRPYAEKRLRDMNVT